MLPPLIFWVDAPFGPRKSDRLGRLGSSQSASGGGSSWRVAINGDLNMGLIGPSLDTLSY